MFCNKGVLNLLNSQESTVPRVNFLRPAALLENRQVFSCDFSEIFKNTFFSRTPPVAASESKQVIA